MAKVEKAKRAVPQHVRDAMNSGKFRTWADLEQASGYGTSWLSRIASGKTPSTSPERIAKLEEVLGVSQSTSAMAPIVDEVHEERSSGPGTVVDIHGAGAFFHLLFPTSSKVDIVMQPDGVRIQSVHIDGRSVDTPKTPSAEPT